MAAALDLFWFSLDLPPARIPALRALLSPEERARADRFLLPEHGRRFIAAHARLRALLARYLGGSPEALRFELGPGGKPALLGAELQFNLSHSRGHALVGIHPYREVGVDIETERSAMNHLGLARRFFTPAEITWLESLPPAARPRGFARLWTCKEAWMKADGRGLALPLDRVEVSFAAGVSLRQITPPFQSWFVRELDPLPGFAAAVVQTEVQTEPPPKLTLAELGPDALP